MFVVYRDAQKGANNYIVFFIHKYDCKIIIIIIMLFIRMIILSGIY